MKRTHVMMWMGICSLMLAVGMLVGCGIAEQISQQMPPAEVPDTSTAPSKSQCTFNCPSGKVLASETTLGRCTLYVVNKMCVATINPGGCEGTSKGYKVLLQNQSGAVVEVRNEALQNGKWGAHWGEKKEIRPNGSYEWGMAATHGTGVRFVCP